MEEIVLFKKLEEFNEVQSNIVTEIKNNINYINRLITTVFSPDFPIFDSTTNCYIPQFQNFQHPQNEYLVWRHFNGDDLIFYIENNIWYCINSNNSDVYLVPFTQFMKVQKADDKILIKYINYVLSLDKIISKRIDELICSFNGTPQNLDDFISKIKDVDYESKNNTTKLPDNS